MAETLETINQWAEETFGPIDSELAVLYRLNKELLELEDAILDDFDEQIKIEAADCIVILMRLTDWETIEKKMAINRARKWELNGDGTGQHIE